jgi:hypothetical protein
MLRASKISPTKHLSPKQAMSPNTKTSSNILRNSGGKKNSLNSSPNSSSSSKAKKVKKSSQKSKDKDAEGGQRQMGHKDKGDTDKLKDTVVQQILESCDSDFDIAAYGIRYVNPMCMCMCACIYGCMCTK